MIGWKRPKIEDLVEGARARVQHVTDVSGRRPVFTWIEGTLYKRGKRQIMFRSDTSSFEVEIGSVTQVDVWK